MGVFRQLGDPVAAAAGLCQHHGAEYAELGGTAGPATPAVLSDVIADGTAIVQVAITTTETCCIVVNSAIMTSHFYPTTNFEIERPMGTIRTQQEDVVLSDSVALMHHAAWEVLAAGTYTYYLVNRAGAGQAIYAAWLKAIASDCLG